jgi:hypothetical protein
MKKLFTTLALAAVVASSFAAAAPARAAEADAVPQLIPQLIKPDLGDLKPRALPSISPSLFLIRKAELTSQLAVFSSYHPYFNPNPSPLYRNVWCLVRNTGLANSGWFQTRIRMNRRGPLPFLSLPTITVYPWMNVPVGGYNLVGYRVYAPWGFSQVTSFADIGFVVPEYNEGNNGDSIP